MAKRIINLIMTIITGTALYVMLLAYWFFYIPAIATGHWVAFNYVILGSILLTVFILTKNLIKIVKK